MCGDSHLIRLPSRQSQFLQVIAAYSMYENISHVKKKSHSTKANIGNDYLAA